MQSEVSQVNALGRYTSCITIIGRTKELHIAICHSLHSHACNNEGSSSDAKHCRRNNVSIPLAFDHFPLCFPAHVSIIEQ